MPTLFGVAEKKLGLLSATQSSWWALRRKQCWDWWLLDRVCAGASSTAQLCSQAAKRAHGPVSGVIIGKVKKMGCIHFSS